MKYLVLVSHGEFAAGLKTSLMMLAGQRDDVIASGLPDGKTADEFAEIFKESVKDIHEDDEIVLLADIVGGSPLTTALNVLAEKGLMEKTTTIGGMNLPLALTSVLMKDTLQGDSFVQAVLSEATTALQEFKVVEDDEDDDQEQERRHSAEAAGRSCVCCKDIVEHLITSNLRKCTACQL